MEPAPATSRETRHVRVYREMADKIGGIIEIEGGSAAALMDELAGKQVDERFERVRPRLEAIQAIKAGDPRPDLGNPVA